MKIITVTMDEAVALVEQGKASKKFFGLDFIKRTNGWLRPMIGRGGVTKHLVGGELGYNPKEKNLVGVWDATVEDNTKAYRMINCDAIVRVTLEGQTYQVRGMEGAISTAEAKEASDRAKGKTK